MEKRLPGAPARNGQGEAHEMGPMKGAQNLASSFRGNDKQGNRNYVYIGGLPHVSFHADAGFKFLDSVAMANHDAIASFPGGWRRIGSLTTLSGFHDSDSAETCARAFAFAASQNCSSFSFDNSERCCPECEASLS